MATIKEIAKRAQTSIGTVSRVLNFDESLRVSEEKKALILKIAEELQYKTISQRHAKTTYTIGVVSMYTTLEELEDPFYLSIRLGVEKRIKDENIHLIVLNDVQNGYDYSKLKNVDGIIGIGHFTKQEIKAFSQITENIVFVNSNPYPNKFDSILFDGENAVKEVMDYLIRRNHTKIGFIGVKEIRESKKIDLAEHRYELVQKYLESKGLYEEKFIHHGGRTYHDGYRIMKKIIDTDELPTAFFIGNDSMCIGALTALYEAGIRVPEHMSIIGYNDIAHAEFSLPPLTTVKVYTELMGEKAYELLIDRIKGRDIPLKLITPTKLVTRNSVGKHQEETP
ncbi:MAG: LacI family DNA-binding transcriptional regulator [Candidatus Izemoplasmataceae bacterium]|jgi:LacI family transcriptional regulator|uniref:LacI family DNA-binding transcriptional regulator n=1 Tax=Liberiplasma polymorphum TaxID=3374570 RepID=UPI0037757A35